MTLETYDSDNIFAKIIAGVLASPKVAQEEKI